jgi:tetratricopeptide (TPR) repeat protein
MADPRELPQALRSTRWQQICAALAEAPSLPPERRCRLAALLHALGLYRPLLALAPPGAPIDGAGPREAEMAWWCASARYMLGLPARIGDYDDANLSGFVDLARCPSAPGLVRFNAAALIFVHLAKTGADAGELAGWAGPLELALANAVGEADPFNAVLITSRCWRALALLPQRVGDRAEMKRLMDLAQQQALALQPADAAQQHLYRENLHALWESRSKEALWLGDDERALACSRAVIEVDPYDAKAWVELGQIHFRSHRWREAARAAWPASARRSAAAPRRRPRPHAAAAACACAAPSSAAGGWRCRPSLPRGPAWPGRTRRCGWPCAPGCQCPSAPSPKRSGKV